MDVSFRVKHYTKPFCTTVIHTDKKLVYRACNILLVIKWYFNQKPVPELRDTLSWPQVPEVLGLAKAIYVAVFLFYVTVNSQRE